MSIEAGVVVDLDCEPIYWHLPEGRDGGALPDSRALWQKLWLNREQVLGFAHTHLGSGEPTPSYVDLTTFAAIESGLDQRLVWWIASADSFIELCWVGPGRLDYVKGPAMYEPEWMSELRTLSRL